MEKCVTSKALSFSFFRRRDAPVLLVLSKTVRLADFTKVGEMRPAFGAGVSMLEAARAARRSSAQLSPQGRKAAKEGRDAAKLRYETVRAPASDVRPLAAVD